MPSVETAKLRMAELASSCGTANQIRTVFAPLGTLTWKTFFTWKLACLGCPPGVLSVGAVAPERQMDSAMAAATLLSVMTWLPSCADAGPSAAREQEGRRSANESRLPRASVLPVRQELAVHHDPDPIPLRVRHPFQRHLVIDGAHDAVAELLVDQLL